MRSSSTRLLRWVAFGFGAIGVGLLPWAVWLSASLPPRHVTHSWDLAWSGFDTALAVSFLATALAAHRRSSWLGPLAAATGTLLLTDAWFDVVLESHANELRKAVALALVGELPIALACFWIAFRAQRLVREASHVTPARERAAEGDLVGVFEIGADGEPAREPRHTDAAT